jgi:hypothetical protein
MSVTQELADDVLSEISQPQDIYDSDDEQIMYGGDSQSSTTKKNAKKFVPNDNLHFQTKVKSSKIEFFATRYSPGNRIRHAISGMHEKIQCGSAYEDLYFKVNHATGEFGNKDPLILFYDTPEQFERHWDTNVSSELKEKWNNKYVIAQKRYLNSL